MDLLPKSSSEFAQSDYWDQFFKKRGQQAFEWYGEYPELCGILHKYILARDRILVIGCGNSGLSSDLYNVGYKDIMNIDTSSVVIREMERKYRDKPGLNYRLMDATDMAFPDGAFSVVLDKGTLDAMMPDTSPQTVANVEKLYSEIDRVMSPFGRFVCVSLLQPHILSSLAEMCSARGWMVRVSRCEEAERPIGDGGISFPVFVVICTKLKKMPNIESVIEFSHSGETFYRVASVDHLLSTVKSLQDIAMVCGGLRRCSVAGTGEISVDVIGLNSTKCEFSPRYTVTVLDSNPSLNTTNLSYGAFIVPRGRELEWLFGTPEGRLSLLASTRYDRLAVIRLQRGQEYEDMETVQREVSDIIMKMSPSYKSGVPQPEIPFMSVGSDLGEVTEVARGNSELSGEYVVEDVKGASDQLLRRLVFLCNQGAVQSEARLITVEENGSVRTKVDVSYLSCEHHIYMTLGVTIVAPLDKLCHVLVIGLGGGGLCHYIRACFQNVKITAVDIDPTIREIATNYFDLQEDERLQVVIEDGLNYLNTAASRGVKFDAILFDVDNKDPGLGLSFPPISFLDPAILSAVSETLNDSGIFVLNFVCRVNLIRQQTWTKLRNLFKDIFSVKLAEEVNEVILCFKNKPLLSLEEAVHKLNSTVKNRKVRTTDLIDVKEVMSNLRLY